ncbi:MAG: hypothetical protein P8Q41_12095 [Saprospiraceae bacterium]|nr:hypothetical protein [Saprospiraceae bacterium]
MKKYQYKCTLQSDVIISSRAATTGFNNSLDYIPGSKFLGIVAGKLYDENNREKTLDLFHNGKVKFYDAQPYFKGERTEKVPFSWFYPKGKNLSDKILLHHKMHLLSNSEWTELLPKQARTGYFNSKGALLESKQSFSIKSAYDRETLKSKDQQMYGYFALPKGSTWAFIVEDETGKYTDEIKSNLEGKHGVGRSRSAEYGLVEIQFDKEIIEKEEAETLNGDILIYASSNLCFYDEFGRTTAQPSPENFNLPSDSIIDWENSQVRNRVYQTWNRKRFNRDADRLIIEKGSVFSVKLNGSVSKNIFKNGIGAHRSEGFGQVLIQPGFLKSENAALDFQLSKVSEWNNLSTSTILKTGTNDQVVIDFINNQDSQIKKLFSIDEMVNKFIKEKGNIYQGLSSSQWGMLRNYAKHSANIEVFKKMVFEKDFGCLNRGKSEKDWRKNGRREKLKKFLFEEGQIDENAVISFTIKLSSQMAKQKSN